MSKRPDERMTFDWSGGHRSSWTLALLIFVSLVLHSAAFFFVHISTSERQLIPKSAQPIQLLTRFAPDGSPSPENEAVLRWIAAEDPAIVARVTNVEPAGLLSIPYRPSYAVSRTRPRDVPAEPATIQYPPARDSLEFIMSADEKPTPATAPLPERATEIAFRSPLNSRVPAKITLTLEATSAQSLNTVELLVGVGGEGDVRFSFVQESSGVPEMDAEAIRLVSGIRLGRAPEPMTWGSVTVRWGTDAITKEP